MFTLLSGNTPFALDRNDSHELILARTSIKLQFIGPTWERVTDNAKVIIYYLLLDLLGIFLGTRKFNA